MRQADGQSDRMATNAFTCFYRYVPANVKTFLNDTYYDLMNVVDELQEDLTTAEKQKRLMMEKATNQNGGPKAKLKLTTSKSDPVLL